MKQILTTVFFIGYTLIVNAQAKSNKTENENSSFKASLSYISNDVYYGRQDSILTPYITPTFGYYDKSGFYVDGSISYLASSTSRIDLGTIDIGYDFKSGDNFSGGVYASKFFNSKNSTSVKSQITADIGANATYNTPFISFTGGADLIFSQQTDFIINYGISHPFTFGEENNLWTIEPSIISNAGTQNFYAATKTKKRNTPTNVKVSGSNAFVALDYEMSLPISYDAAKWGFSFTPTYALPQNPISVTAPNGTILTQEKLSNVFYAELVFYVKF